MWILFVHFNILQGKGQTDEALKYGAKGISMVSICGLSVMALTLLFTTPILWLFGATEEVLPYAQTYLRITAIGIPFLMLTNGGTLLIRADGSPKYTLLCSVAGVGTNIVLDFLFLYPMGMGVEGAALATILGQILSAVLVVRYLRKLKTGPLKKEYFKVQKSYVANMVKIGAAASLNQVAMLLSQVVLNSSLRHYGELSVYGSSEALAAAARYETVKNDLEYAESRVQTLSLELRKLGNCERKLDEMVEEKKQKMLNKLKIMRNMIIL